MPSRSPPRPDQTHRTDYSQLKRRAPKHIHWRTITTYTATYKAGKKGKGKQTLTVRTVNKPPLVEREFRLAGDTLKTFKRMDLKQHTRKAIIIMATKTKDKKDAKTSKTRKKPVDEEVDEELEGLEELSEEDEDTDTEDESTDDESTDDDSGDDADEDVDEPKSKKGKKKSKKDKKSKEKGSRAKSNGKIGTQEIAEAAGCDARTLRMVLRKHKVEKDEETNRYEWDSLDSPEVKKILKLIKEGAAKEIKQESLDKLKEKKVGEKKGKKDKKGKKNKKKVEDED